MNLFTSQSGEELIKKTVKKKKRAKWEIRIAAVLPAKTSQNISEFLFLMA